MQKTLPLVSIGMPVYNGERFLERAIDSIRSQDYPNLEIIISDNCSTDATREISLRLAKQDQRIRYSKNENNIGAVPNFAKSLELANGKYFMWAACDDQWDEKCISLLSRELSNYPKSVLAHSGIAMRDEDGELLSRRVFPDDNNPNTWSRFQTAIKCSSAAKGTPKLNFAMYGLYRTDALRKAMPYVHNGAFWDRLFVILSAMIGPFRYVPNTLYHRTLHNTGADKRYPEDSYARHIKESEWWRFHVIMSLWKLLWACPHIPGRKKIQIPVVVFRFAMTQLIKRHPLRGKLNFLRFWSSGKQSKKKSRKKTRGSKTQAMT